MIRRIVLLLSSLLSMAFAQATPLARDSFSGSGTVLNADQLALIINQEDPRSVELGERYATERGIPTVNKIFVRISNESKAISPETFARLKAEIDAQLPERIQAVLFVWTTPYQVGCNALTGAFTLGYQADLCHNTCNKSRVSPYFNHPTRQPFLSTGLRLSMHLPLEQGQALIERGLRADGQWPNGSAYFLRTSDSHRNSRARFFPPNGEIKLPPLRLQNLQMDALRDKADVMFYFTGMPQVQGLETLRFLPGAVADHLTSSGGDLLGKGQMSALRWLDAGATGSYGTVTEPCNHWEKFPHPGVLLRHYLNGETLIEAYWKSVAWPGQGVFIGEPLTTPYRWSFR